MEFTTVLTIKRSDALKIFKENEEDYERFCHIKDKILIEKDYSVLNFRCFYCRSLKHTICDCPYIHYVPDIEKIIKKHEFYEEAPRKIVKRRRRQRFYKTEIIIDAKCFQEKDEKTISTSKMNQYDEISQISEESHKHENNECSEDLMSSNNREAREKENHKSSLLHLDLEGEKEKKANYDNYVSDQKLPTFPENSIGDLPPPQLIPSTIVPESSFKEKNPYFIDKVKNFRNYYPENNCLEIIKNTHSMNNNHMKLQIFASSNYSDKYTETEILKKLQKFKLYSFAVGKFKDLILLKILRKSKIDIKKDEGGILSPNSPNSSVRRKKKFSDFSGFFERTKGFMEGINLQTVAKTALNKSHMVKKVETMIKSKPTLKSKKNIRVFDKNP